MANVYQGNGQPQLRSDGVYGWGSNPAYRNAPCPGGPGSHHGHPRASGTLLRTETPAYRQPQDVHPIEVHALAEGMTQVPVVDANGFAQAPIAIVLPRAAQ